MDKRLKEVKVVKACTTGGSWGEAVVDMDLDHFRKSDIIMRLGDNAKFIVVLHVIENPTHLYVLSLDNNSLKEGDRVIYFTNIL